MAFSDMYVLLPFVIHRCLTVLVSEYLTIIDIIHARRTTTRKMTIQSLGVVEMNALIKPLRYSSMNRCTVTLTLFQHTLLSTVVQDFLPKYPIDPAVANATRSIVQARCGST
ncbi:hypothetical protein BDY19DRAFT_707599 [Irpex rosettiformis]|uniref:Uncharacterized protein n=1 Tax=Irpex rosettiformis TaxID=378272 RepID=A0ACB8TMX6_9APHY|nr:hypothetical protein BDY19DRAFT_707599 [Irpex rosettiformis]